MTEKRLDVNSIDDLFVREELIRLYEENERLLEEKIDAETKLYKANEQLLMQMDYDNLCKENQDMEFELIKIKKENKQLQEERGYFEGKKCEYFNKYNKKHLENIQLKEENEQLKQKKEHIVKLLNKKATELYKENKQLKQFKEEVFDLIDKHIDFWSKKYDLAGVDVLQKLKKDLKGDGDD